MATAAAARQHTIVVAVTTAQPSIRPSLLPPLTALAIGNSNGNSNGSTSALMELPLTALPAAAAARLAQSIFPEGR